MNGLELESVFSAFWRPQSESLTLFFPSFKLHFLPSSYWREMPQSSIPTRYQVKLKLVTLQLKLAVQWQKMTDYLWLCGTVKATDGYQYLFTRIDTSGIANIERWFFDVRNTTLAGAKRWMSSSCTWSKRRSSKPLLVTSQKKSGTGRRKCQFYRSIHGNQLLPIHCISQEVTRRW